MTRNQIRARLIEREGSINAVADRLCIERSRISATINYLRLNLDVRKELIRTYKIKFSPNIQPAKSQRKPRRKQGESATA